MTMIFHFANVNYLLRMNLESPRATVRGATSGEVSRPEWALRRQKLVSAPSSDIFPRHIFLVHVRLLFSTPRASASAFCARFRLRRLLRAFLLLRLCFTSEPYPWGTRKKILENVQAFFFSLGARSRGKPPFGTTASRDFTLK